MWNRMGGRRQDCLFLSFRLVLIVVTGANIKKNLTRTEFSWCFRIQRINRNHFEIFVDEKKRNIIDAFLFI